MIQITNTVKHLIIINVILFIGKLALQTKGINLDQYLALYFVENEMFKPWQILSHMFMHADFSHLLFNMIGLWMFGSAVEKAFGRNKFLFLYFSAGLGAYLLHFGIDYFGYMNDLSQLASIGYQKSEVVSIISEGQYLKEWDSVLGAGNANQLGLDFNIPMLGASGAIFGILVAFGMLFPNAELMLIFLPIPVKAKYFIPILIALDLFSGFTGRAIFSPANTAYWAHIGGALTGFLIMLYWRKNQFNKHRWD